MDGTARDHEGTDATDALDVLDWRRRIHLLYAEVRVSDPSAAFDRLRG